jgi:8-oxo-dGTP diphosphatase
LNQVSKPEVKAAGGVVWRRGPEADLEVVVVHRPAYDDWSLPKGKLEEGETESEAALREVEEETGLRCRIGVPLPSTTYLDRLGRTKTVSYWVMDVAAGELGAANEVDQARWTSLEEARQVLTYPRDKEVLEAFTAITANGKMIPQ